MAKEYLAAQLLRDEEANESYARAQDFFYATPPAFASLAATPPTPDSFANALGSVQFYVIGQKPNDPIWSNIMNENADNLLGMGGLVYDYMRKTYPGINTQTLDINTWRNIVQNIPDLSIGKAVSKPWKYSTPGNKVPGAFLSMIANAVIAEAGTLLPDFTSYLSSIGDVLFSMHRGGETYTALIFTISNYLIQNGPSCSDYGAITIRQIKFAETFVELKGACSTTNNVDIDVLYTEIENKVQTDRIRRGGPHHEKFQQLVNANSTVQFLRAKNLFNKPAIPQNELKPAL